MKRLKNGYNILSNKIQVFLQSFLISSYITEVSEAHRISISFCMKKKSCLRPPKKVTSGGPISKLIYREDRA